MLIGIDFGTTRTVVASVDRGNYPVVSFQPESGDTRDWFPSVFAVRKREIVYGFDAASKHGEADWHVMRSFKRYLGTLGPDDRLTVGEQSLSPLELLTGFLTKLREDLLTRSNLRAR